MRADTTSVTTGATDIESAPAARRVIAASAAAPEHSTQPLNPMDRVLLAVNNVLGSWGYSGFETQMIVWLGGRADTLALRSALARIHLRYPVLTARLVEHAPHGPCWQYRSGGECPLEEVTLESADSQAVLDHASKLLALHHNLATSDPIRFYLMHRPGGRDVFLMQYNHVLMDNFAAIPLVGEIDRLSRGTSVDAIGPAAAAPDLIAQHLRRFSRWRRLRAAYRTALLRIYTLSGQPTILGPTDSGHPGPNPYRLAMRTISAQELEAVTLRMHRAASLPSLSMLILASVFQAMLKFRPCHHTKLISFVVGLGVELSRRSGLQSLFQTQASVVPVRARLDQLADFDELVGVLAGELRDRLHRDIDLGTVQLASMFQNWPRLTNWAVTRLLRSGYSLWYAYFGSQDHASDAFCAAPISEISYAASAWAPLGMTLIANQSRGRLILHATYMPNLVTDSTARSFLDAIVAGLHSASSK